MSYLTIKPEQSYGDLVKRESKYEYNEYINK